MSCDFHEPMFGASYPDARCIDGFLWDEDSCDEPGGPLTGGGDIPCPQCNHKAWMEYHKDAFETEGYVAAEANQPRICEPHKVHHEQPGDKELRATWWLAGYDQCVAERSGVRPS